MPRLQFRVFVLAIGCLVKVHGQTLTADPNPINLAPGSTVGKTTLSWNAPGHTSLQIFAGSTLFATGLASSGAIDTGNWVSDGLVFSLVDPTSGRALATVAAHAMSGFSPPIYSVKTFAGGGFPQNIQGTSAVLGEVKGLALDAAGNIFIPLFDYSVVLRLAPNGQLTLVAGNGVPGFSGDGGPATSAQLNEPTGISVDATGTIVSVISYYRQAMEDESRLCASPFLSGA